MVPVAELRLCALLLSAVYLCIRYYDVRPQSTPEEGPPPHQIRHAPCGQPCLHASDLPCYSAHHMYEMPNTFMVITCQHIPSQ